MKELSIEEKAKAYDNLIERLKDLKFAYRFSPLSDTIEEKFPELKESEDERTRKELIKYIRKTTCVNFIGKCSKKEAEKFISWLEKQGKDNMSISEATKQELEDNLHKALEKETAESWNEFLDEQGEQKPVDRVEPRFKVGDIISNGISEVKIVSIDKNYYIVTNDEIENDAHVCNWVVYFKNQDDWKLVEKKSSWSEEDERTYKSVLYAFEHNYPLNHEQQKFVKSLKDKVHPKQEWSDEDYNEIETIACHLDNTDYEDMAEVLRSMRDKYYHIIPQNTWKPSDEQMIALQEAVNIIGILTITGSKIYSLYQDLKKLSYEIDKKEHII